MGSLFALRRVRREFLLLVHQLRRRIMMLEVDNHLRTPASLAALIGRDQQL